MPAVLQILLTGVVLGLSIAAPPGPVTALSVQLVVSRSWLSGWLVMVGATLADGVFFVLTYYGVARLVTPEERGALFVVGGMLMLYLALSTVRTAGRRGGGALPSRSSRWSSSAAGRSPFLLGLSIGLTNPYQFGWWVAVGASMVSDFGPSVAVGFFVGIVSWTLVVTALVHEGARRYQRLAPVIAYASAAIMVGFGVWFLVVGLSTTML
ncbi:MAG: LysE family transporter [Thaumarchaeota archaeon]|nr:LysE family transporter [Nitrososphaerota archaeon]